MTIGAIFTLIYTTQDLVTLRHLTLILCIALLGCHDDSAPKSKSRNQNDVPRYDQIKISDIDFKGFTANEKQRKKNICQSVYQQAWVANKVSAGMLIAQHGEIIYENYLGMADKSKNKKLTAETPLHIASTSKVMTALAMLKLVEAQKIGLDDTVGSVLRSFPYEGVTLRHLLSHRSGLPNYLYFAGDKKYWEDPEKPLYNKDVLQIMIDKKPDKASAPGTHFSYNNTNYVLIALIIERLTRMPYPQAMEYILFEPLGMSHTYVSRWPQDTSRNSVSYYHNGNPWPYDILDATYGDKNIYSTPRDMYKLDCAMYAPGFLDSALKAQATQGYSYESKGIKNYGLGIRMMEFDDGGKFLYHNGWWHGNNSVYLRDYKHEAVIIAFGNLYTRSVYAPFSLVTMFGNYQLPVDSSVLREQDSIRRMQQLQDSIDQAQSQAKNKQNKKSDTIIDLSAKRKKKGHDHRPL